MSTCSLILHLLPKHPEANFSGIAHFVNVYHNYFVTVIYFLNSID